jgi:leucyl-tRNA synthetase
MMQGMKPKPYDHAHIEQKWQKEWAKEKVFETEGLSDKPKFYALIEFPYPSGQGLHVGHVRSNTAMDIISRKRRMEGYNVLYPIGWDAFGLPTENYAIKTGKQPALITKENTDNFRRQLQSLGFSFDWSREINTTDPTYYKWTQWIFLQMFKQGLAYKKKMAINWCPKDKIGLANEEVVNGCCERCGTVVEKREKEQWMLAITKYADRLDKDLDDVDYLPQIKAQQRNWIGKSEGALIRFKILDLGFKNGTEKEIEVFTTRPDTLFGVTYVVLAPEHPLVQSIVNGHESIVENIEEIKKYTESVKVKSDIDRTDAKKEKTGVELKGIMAVNPVSGKEVPVWIADYVLADYGTGAVMAVPAHDERDFVFAKKYNLPIQFVLMHHNFDHENPPREGKKDTVREVVHVILRNTKNQTVLTEFLKGEEWGKDKPKTLIIGGIESGETEMDAAVREIKEETGYKNVKFVEEIPMQSSATFFAAHKDVNRVVYVKCLVFDLIDEDRDGIIEDEHFTKDTHEIKWVPYADVADTLTIIGNKFSWKYFYEGAYAFTGEGVLTNSDQFDRMASQEAKKKITEFAGGKMVTTYKLRDWVFSRQRYWGEPIPLVFCENCKKQVEISNSNKKNESQISKGEQMNPGWIPVSEDQLPVELPKVDKYEPTDNGESPLASIGDWVNVKCPTCGGDAKRETDTMPQWAGSSWYYLAYTSQGISNFKFQISKENEEFKYWTPVDWYNGGMEHTTLHLLYSRFWHKFLFDQGLVPTSEPYQKRTSHGLILAEGGEKMSKSKGNVVNPDEIVKMWGADSLRLHEMFMGPFDQPVSWNSESIIGVRRFLERIWRLGESVVNSQQSIEKKDNSNSSLKTNDYQLSTILHKTIQKVTQDIEDMHFNTAISTMMVLVNEMEKQEKIVREDVEIFLKLLSPFAPHIAEEIWQSLGNTESIALATWPVADMSKMVETSTVVVVQVNGKVRGQVSAPIDASENDILTLVKENSSVSKWLGENEPKKVIYIKNRLINVVF